jgi:hypothetical protein
MYVVLSTVKPRLDLTGQKHIKMTSSHRDKEGRKEYDRLRYVNRTPEQKERRKELEKLRYKNRTPEQRERDRIKNTNLTPEQRERKNFKGREQYRNLSEEERQAKLTKDKARQSNNYDINKQWAVNYKGGKCKHCGFTSIHLNVFDFHHINPNEKEFELSEKWKQASHETFKKKVKPELDKCLLLCANCHRIQHSKWNEERIKND